MERRTGPRKHLVTLVVDADDGDVHHDEPMFHGNACIGYVTLGSFAHDVRKSVAMGYVPVKLVTAGTLFQVEILGAMRSAAIQRVPLHHPNGIRMRS